MSRVRLTRRLVLEAPQRTADSGGGFAVTWLALGTLWADIRTASSREEFIAAVERPRVRYRITVRGAPVGSSHRPAVEQRFREGMRVFDILTVAEAGSDGRYLEILAEEGIAA